MPERSLRRAFLPHSRHVRLLNIGVAWVVILATGCGGMASADSHQDSGSSPEDAGTALCSNSPACTGVGAICPNDSTLITCTRTDDGCLVASATQCALNQTCQKDGGDAHCACVPNTACSSLGTSCQDPATLVTCTLDSSNCLVSTPTTCPTGEDCMGSAPSAACGCLNETPCAATGPNCAGTSEIVTCTADAHGCLSATQASACPDHESCKGNAGSAACSCANDPACQGAGPVCADAAETESCSADSNGCLYVSSAPIACPAPTTACSAGQCICPIAEEIVCSGACTDTATDANNCGACGVACAADQICSSHLCTCNPDYHPDGTRGVFVREDSGDDRTGLGTATSPYATINKGISAAMAAGLPNIYVGPGQYFESEAISDSAEGISVQGGWTINGESWSQDCRATARANTLLLGGSVAVKANNVVHASGFSHMTIEAVSSTATPADAGAASVIGVFVDGPNSVFYLKDVLVVASDAPSGGAASSGTSGSNFTNGGGFLCGDGANGPNPTAGSSARNQGVFSAIGFSPADGASGTSGTAGNPGTRGGSGTCAQVYTCSAECGSCSSIPTGSVCGTSGFCGPGGGGGGVGSAGRGGGASVAVLVDGSNAVLTAVGSSLRSGKGGAGSSGGSGGQGGLFSSGSSGSQKCLSSAATNSCIASGQCSCGFFCTKTSFSCGNFETVCGQAGGPGGSGGLGGNGSAGGGGAGGPSYALVTVGGALANIDVASALAFGTGGPGAGGAPTGNAAAIHNGP
jgi:hypothetical protein